MGTVINDGDVQNMASMQSLAAMMEEVDADGDGTINFDEFMGMMGAPSDPTSATSHRPSASHGLSAASRKRSQDLDATSAASHRPSASHRLSAASRKRSQ